MNFDDIEVKEEFFENNEESSELSNDRSIETINAEKNTYEIETSTNTMPSKNIEDEINAHTSVDEQNFQLNTSHNIANSDSERSNGINQTSSQEDLITDKPIKKRKRQLLKSIDSISDKLVKNKGKILNDKLSNKNIDKSNKTLNCDNIDKSSDTINSLSCKNSISINEKNDSTNIDTESSENNVNTEIHISTSNELSKNAIDVSNATLNNYISHDESDKSDDSEDLWQPNTAKRKVQNKKVNKQVTSKVGDKEMNKIGHIAKCQYCPEKFEKVMTMRKHCKEVHNEKATVFKCGEDACDKEFIVPRKLYRHFDTKHNMPYEKCEICGKLLRRNYMKTHRQYHEGLLDKYQCGTCDKIFQTKHLLETHLSTEEHERPRKKQTVMCEVCGKTLLKNSLSNHMKLHKEIVTQVKQICEICGNSYASSYIAEHQLTHSTVRAYVCEICGKDYKTGRRLKTHKMIHYEKIRLTCDKCGNTFSTLHTLKKHKLYIHSNLRPHECKYCTKSFKDRKHLSIHERIHTGERPYKCIICPSAFYESGNLTKHMRKVHQTEPSKKSE